MALHITSIVTTITTVVLEGCDINVKRRVPSRRDLPHHQHLLYLSDLVTTFRPCSLPSDLACHRIQSLPPPPDLTATPRVTPTLMVQTSMANGEMVHYTSPVPIPPPPANGTNLQRPSAYREAHNTTSWVDGGQEVDAGSKSYAGQEQDDGLENCSTKIPYHL
jgi:hypothetical protein